MSPTNPRVGSGFRELTIEEIASSRLGAIKIGPFGSQLKKQDMSPTGYKVYGQENIIAEDFSLGDRRIDAAKYSTLKSCQLYPGDVVITMMGTVGKCAVFPAAAEEGIMDSHLLRIQVNPQKANPRFLSLAVSSQELLGRQIARMSHGSIMSGLSSSIIRRLRVPVPSLPEQDRIVDILCTIDEAIQQTEALIAKLKEVRAGLLHDLLTRSLDEQGQLRDPTSHPEEFKDSPLGRLPRAWEIDRLGRLLPRIDAGKSPDCPDIPAAPGQWGVLKVSAVAPDGFRPEENKAINKRQHINPAYEVRDRDVLLSRANTYALVGLVCLVHEPPPRLMLCDKTLRLHVNDSLATKEYVALTLQSRPVRKQIEIHATGTSGSMKNISQDAIRNLLVPRPSLEEQRRITADVGAHYTRIRSEELYRRKLGLLKNGLMHDLLNGVVRVKASPESDKDEWFS